MKKAKIIITIITLAALVLTLGACGRKTDLSVEQGLVIRTADGSIMCLLSSGPTVLSDGTGDTNAFDGLMTGDTIEIEYDVILETFPAKTTAYKIKKLAAEKKEIPADTVNSLTALGYEIDYGKAEADGVYDVATVTNMHAGIEMPIPDGWSSKSFSPATDGNKDIAVCFYLADSKAEFTVRYYDDGFAVCGTGLETKEHTTTGGYTCDIGYYDGKDCWDYILVKDAQGCYAVTCTDATKAECDEFLKCFDSVKLGDGTGLTYAEAMECAEKNCDAKNSPTLNYNCENGGWEVNFCNNDGECVETMHIDADGNCNRDNSTHHSENTAAQTTAHHTEAATEHHTETATEHHTETATEHHTEVEHTQETVCDPTVATTQAHHEEGEHH